jgi:hypothetical protein
MVAAIPRQNVIDLPAMYLLNRAGMDYCVGKQVPLRDLRDFDGERGVGFEWQRCSADSLERLVRGRMLSSIEMRRPDFISARPSIIMMTRLILEGLLRSRFNYQLKRDLVSRPDIAAMLARPPIAAIFASRSSIDEGLRSGGGRLSTLVGDIGAECSSRAARGEWFEEPEEGLERCARLIEAIVPETRLLASLAGEVAVRTVAETVMAYAGRMELAGQLSLFLMEFIQVAEKAYLLSMAEYDRYVRSHPEELPRLFAEPSFRERLFDIAARRGESMALRVSFPSVPGDRGVPRCLEIAVRTKGLVGCGDWALEADKGPGRREKSVRRMDLATLLRNVARDDEYAELSLAYHASLESACTARGMAFSSSVALDGMKNETVATMRVDVHAPSRAGAISPNPGSKAR